MTCHLCDDHYKNYSYKDYPSLDIHFNKSHFLCPYDECKDRCYVAFQTENELKAHNELCHMRTKATTGSKNVNAWLNFKADDDDERPERGGQKRDKFQKPQRNVLKDKEGVDFGYYFTQKY